MRKSLLLKISRLTGSLWVRLSEMIAVFMSEFFSSTSRKSPFWALSMNTARLELELMWRSW
jgi:hypothetical protein